MKSDYAESVSDDKVWKIYLIPDSLGFVRGYIIPKRKSYAKRDYSFNKRIWFI